MNTPQKKSAFRPSIAWFLLALLVPMGGVWGEERGLGVGVVLGEPTGLSVKKWINTVQAIDIAVGWSLVDAPSRTYLHMEHLWHSAIFYAGLGVRLKQVADTAQAGLRIPLGINLLILPFEVFGEMAPTVAMNSSMAISVNGGLGCRVYF